MSLASCVNLIRVDLGVVNLGNLIRNFSKMCLLIMFPCLIFVFLIGILSGQALKFLRYYP